MSETHFKNKALKYLRGLDCSWWVKLAAGQWQVPGLPDVVGCLHGRFVAIELKDGNNQPSRLQTKILKCIAEAGGVTAVCWTLAEVQATVAPVLAQVSRDASR